MKSPIPFLRKIAFIEAISFLVLLIVAMPLKYAFGIPWPVKIVGWVHGVLFIAFCWALLKTMWVARWSFGRSALIFIAALVPFGPFLVDRRMLGYEAEFQSRVQAKSATQPVEQEA